MTSSQVAQNGPPPLQPILAPLDEVKQRDIIKKSVTLESGCYLSSGESCKLYWNEKYEQETCHGMH